MNPGPWAIAAVVLSMSAQSAGAELTPVGDEFEVTAYTTSYAYAPRVTADSAGGFVVVWDASSGTTERTTDVFGRRFDANGAPLTTEFLVNEYSSGIQSGPSVALANDGQFLVAWSGAGADDASDSFARLFQPDAAPKAAEFRLHDPTLGGVQHSPAVAWDDTFLVGWVDDFGVSGVRVDAAGNLTKPFEVPVNLPKRVALDTESGGEFVVVWSTHSYAGGHIYGGYEGVISGRRYAADAAGYSRFEVNLFRDDPTGYGFVLDGSNSLSISADARGDFAVGNDSYVSDYYYNVDEQVDGYDLGMKLEHFVNGASEGSLFLDEGDDGARRIGPDIAKTPGGNTVVVWSDDAESARVIDSSPADTEEDAIFARVLDCNGEDETNGAVQINTYTSGAQRRPAVAVTEAGDVIVVWQRAVSGTFPFTIVGRRFELTGACALCGDADANGRVTASDALTALRASVGSSACAAERCDPDGSQTITASDALRILATAVAGGPVDLSCAPAG